MDPLKEVLSIVTDIKSRIRTKLVIVAVWLVASFLAMATSYPVQASQPASRIEVQQAVQDEKILVLQKTVEEDSIRIGQLEHDIWIWRGIVLGFGTIISLLELLQALGFVRGGVEFRRRTGDK